MFYKHFSIYLLSSLAESGLKESLLPPLRVLLPPVDPEDKASLDKSGLSSGLKKGRDPLLLVVPENIFFEGRLREHFLNFR